MGVADILASVDHEIAQLQQARAILLGGSISGKNGAGRTAKSAVAKAKPARKKRNLTPEGRQRIAEAVKRRWAAQRKASAAASK